MSVGDNLQYHGDESINHGSNGLFWGKGKVYIYKEKEQSVISSQR